MRFEAVVFDLFGTLVPSFPIERFEEILRQMAVVVGVPPEEFQRIWADETARARSTGVFGSIEENVRYICERAGVTPEEGKLARAAEIRIGFTRVALQPREDATATLVRLRKEGLRIGLISDCSSEVPLLWPETPFASLIDYPVFSCAVGTKKPDPRIYRLACEGLGVAPEACLYVADGFSHELEGAGRAGLRPILIAAPGEAPVGMPEWEGWGWTGPRITRLGEVVELLGLDAGDQQGGAR